MDIYHADICKVHITAELPECFICRDVQLVDGEPLRRFCDCKNLVAHHHCLLTWVRTGLESEEQLRCRICNAEYQQRRAGLWRTVASQWHIWLVTAVVVLLVALVPYLVYRMLTTFDRPPPHTLFKTASICFGVLSEILLLRLLQCFVMNRYRHARETSFSLQPRSPAEEQEAGVKGHDALWPWKDCAAVEKAKQIDSQ